MSWLRLDDGFASNPKVTALSEVKRWRWVRLLLDCARHAQNEGRVSAAMVREARLEARELLSLGLLDELEGVDGFPWAVHDWDEYNRAATSGARRQARYRAREKLRPSTVARRERQEANRAAWMGEGDVTRDVTGDVTRDGEVTGAVRPAYPSPSNTPTPLGTGPPLQDDSTAAAPATNDGGEWHGGDVDALARAGELLDRAGLLEGEASELALELALRVPVALLDELEAGIPAHGLDPAGYVLSSLRAAVGAS